MSDPPFHIQVLGPPGVRRRGRGECLLPAGKPLALLVYLALREGPVSRDHLGDLLWPGAPRKNQRASLRQSLWILRTSLDVDLCPAEDPLRLTPGLVSVDLREVEGLLERRRPLQAADLWTRPPFRGLRFPDAPGWAHWTEDRASRTQLRLAAALQAEGERREEDGDADGAAAAFEQAARIQPHCPTHVLSRIRLSLAVRRFEEAGERIARARSTFLEDNEVLESLRGLDEEVRILRRGAYPERPGDLSPLSFVGRGREFAALARLWQGLDAGTGGLAILTGARGTGKTRLAAEIGLLARHRGGRIVRVQGHEGESAIRWGAVCELVRRLFALSGASGVTSCAGEALHLLVPSLCGRGEHGSPHRGVHAAPALLPDGAVADAIGDLVSAVCEDGPLLIVVDDLQWVDPISRSVLVSLARRSEREQVLWLFGARRVPSAPPLEGILRSLRERPRAVGLHLVPWTRDQVKELLQAVVRFPCGDSADRAAEAIHTAGAGNPCFTEEILRILARRGALVRDEVRGPEQVTGPGEGPSWRLDMAALSDLPSMRRREPCLERHRRKPLSRRPVRQGRVPVRAPDAALHDAPVTAASLLGTVPVVSFSSGGRQP